MVGMEGNITLDGGRGSSVGVLTIRGSPRLQKGLRHSYATVDVSVAAVLGCTRGSKYRHS